MASIVTDQFRIINANNFVDSVLNDSNSYYTFLGLVNPGAIGFGRTDRWDEGDGIPNPIDNLQYNYHYKDTALFGKKITADNIRRVIKRVDWAANNTYDMYRHDYSIEQPTENSITARLYDSNFYVMNSEYKVYICLDNGASGSPGSSSAKGNPSEDEPTFTDLEPTAAGTSGDGYVWKYLFSVAPSDIIKFDSTEYIVIPNNWSTSTDPQIKNVREAGDSQINLNQIKKVYIEKGGLNYDRGTTGEQILDIIGDGTGGKVLVKINTSGTITSTEIVSGGKDYTYGVVDLGKIQTTGVLPEGDKAKLIPIIPPSRGHGYDIYTELGTDKVLVYTRFDNSTKDFPTDTQFAQVGIIKNPTHPSSTTIFNESTFSSLFGLMIYGDNITGTFNPRKGTKVTQDLGSDGTAVGYVASYDKKTKVLKYSRDRSLYFGNTYDQTDYGDVSLNSKIVEFSQSGGNITVDNGTSNVSVGITNFTGSSLTVSNEEVDLKTTFTNGLSNPEINKKSGELIYIDNRPLVERDARQKEDVKIILEF